MKKFELSALHPDFKRLLTIARDRVKTIDHSEVGIVYLSKDGYYFADWQTGVTRSLSERINSGDFFAAMTKPVPAEKRNNFFHCIGLYGDRLDPESNEEVQEMLRIRDEWNLPIYLMNISEEIWRIEPNDECGRNLIELTTVYSICIK